MIAQESIRKCYELDIVEVISSFVDLKKSGSNYRGLSPFSNEKTPSFMVSPSKRIFKCFSTGIGGNVVKFIEHHEKLSFPDSIKFLCKKYSIPYIEEKTSSQDLFREKRKEGLYKINEFANDFFKKNLLENQVAYNYLINERKISIDTINLFGIGYALNDRSQLSNLLINNKFDWEMCTEISLLTLKDNYLYDRFVDRIMFPIYNHSGNICGFGGRYIGNDSNQAKYLNSSESLIYNKSQVLYGMYQAKKYIVENDMAYLVEGYLDVCQMYQLGIKNVISTSGTSITPDAGKEIKRYSKNVTIIFDSDSAGFKSAIRGIDILLSEGLNVFICTLPPGQDPDNFCSLNGLEFVKNYIATNSIDFLDFKYNELVLKVTDFTAKSEGIKDLINSVSLISDEVLKALYIEKLSKIEAIPRNYINDISRNSYELNPVNSFNEREVSLYFEIKENLEKRIVKYLICYRKRIFDFVEAFIKDGKEFEEVKRRTVEDKIRNEILNDGITFSNYIYANIFDCILNQKKMTDELKSVANSLMKEEMVILGKDGAHRNEVLSRLPKDISDCLLYYKYIYLNDLLEDMIKQDVDEESVFPYFKFMIRVKRYLNLI